MANITGTANPDILTGTALSDLIEGLASDDVLYGFDGNDSLLGDVGDDILYGGSGDDTMDGGAGEDLFYGQSGLDTVTYASALAALTLNMADNSQSTGDAAGDFYLSIENFLLTRFDDTFVGSEFANQASGGDGNDLLILSQGDTGNGGVGSDTFAVTDFGANAQIVDFDPSQDQLLIQYDPKQITDPVVTVQSNDAGETLVMLNGNLVASLTNGAALDAGQISLRALT
jgi:Ca2+-binding RTX toxin-like protein